MSRPATTRLKVNPQLGSMPVLQYCQPEQLQIDSSYQRSLEVAGSQTLIRRMAVHWDWGLCQPLFVARRADGGLYVVDGQHRLSAARLRGDIHQLPCVVTSFASAEEEAASFVALNQQRRPLTTLELFKAALAAGDMEASQIALALNDNGLRLANVSNNQSMAPGSIANVGGLQRCYRRHGIQVLGAALEVLAKAYDGQVLRYAGTIFPGLVAVVVDQQPLSDPGSETIAKIARFVGARSQAAWWQLIAEAQAAGAPNRRMAAERAFQTAWVEHQARPAPIAPIAATPVAAPTRPAAAEEDDLPSILRKAEQAWCDQCDQRVSGARADACKDRFCSMKRKAAA